VTSAVEIPGPFGGQWGSFVPRRIIGASGGTWLAFSRNTANVTESYFTSTDAGATWTRRTLPVAGKLWDALWDGTNFVLHASATGATGVQEGTDGVSWTARTAISVSLSEIIYNGSIYLAVPFSGTTGATSPDRVTWTTRTLAVAVSTPTSGALGAITWNNGAGLFLAQHTTFGQSYQTSPDGATWTARTSLTDYNPALASGVGVLFASSSTVTIAVGPGGLCTTSTDGLTWGTPALIDTAFGTTAGNALAAYHDGTRFVVVLGGFLYYSTNGTSWTKSPCGRLPITSASQVYIRTPTGLAVVVLGRMFHVTDPTSSTPANILAPAPIALTAGTRQYLRIK
jgi:hypothetical protein